MRSEVSKNLNNRKPAWEEYLLRGKSHLQSKHFVLACLDFLRVMGIEPGNLEPYHLFGHALRNSGQIFEPTIEMYDRILSLNPSEGFLYLKRGVALFYFAQVIGDCRSLFDMAIDDLSRAIGLNPHCAASFFFRGKCWDLLPYIEEYDEYEPEFYDEIFDYSLSDFKKALELDPNNPDIHTTLANMYEGDDDNKALYHLQRAAQLNFEDKSNFIPIGSIYEFYDAPQALAFFKKGDKGATRNETVESEEQKQAKNECLLQMV